MKTSELIDDALDWAVCEATGFFKGYTQFRTGKNFLKVWGVARNTHLHPSTNWSQGGPIIEREWIDLHCVNDSWWMAECPAVGGLAMQNGPTPLIAAMRCYVASKLGDDIDIPEELK